MKKQSIKLLNNIKLLLVKKKLVKSNQYILIALSGGQDSIFVLVIFYILKKQWNFKLTVLYCNHLWQKSSIYSFSHIGKTIFCFNVKLHYSITFKKLNSEEVSRYWRSKNYTRISEFSDNSNIILGHSLTDRIETFLFNLIRGSTIPGSLTLKLKKTIINKEKNQFYISETELKYYSVTKKEIFFLKFKLAKTRRIKPQQFIKKEKIKKYSINGLIDKKFLILKKKNSKNNLIRPLIKISRFETKNSSIVNKFPIFLDETNKIEKYTRNRLRKQIIPSLKFFFNKKLDQTFFRYTEILLEENLYFEKTITKLIQIIIQEDNNGYFFNGYVFLSIPLSFKRRICLSLVKEKLSLKYNFFLIDSLIIAIEKFLKNKKIKSVGSKAKGINKIFFPEIGIIYISKNLFLFLK
jgi:tRNA(Ile)-lysidine synthase